MVDNNRFFNTLMSKARSRRSPAGHKWYDAAPTHTPETSGSSDVNKRPVGGGTAGGINYATGQMDLASPTSYGAGRGTMVDYYTGREYSGGPYNYRDAPVDFKTGEQLGSPFVTSVSGMAFAKDDTGVVRAVRAEELEAGLPSNLEFVSSGEAALSAPIGAVGTANPVALDLIDMLTGGTGFATGFLGPTVVGARGKEAAVGSGLPGIFGREKVKKDYEVFENIKAGNPGYHQFYVGNQLVSIAPNEGFLKEKLGIGNEFVAYGNIDIETAKQIIGGAKGIDPRTIDFSKSMEDEAFGERLVGYIPDVGGLTQNLEFVDSSGKINSSVPNPTVYAGLMATAYGNKRAAADLNMLAQKTGSLKMAELAQQAARGELSARAYRDENGQVIGFESPTGGYVTSEKTGEVVKSGSGGYAVYGTGPVSAEAVLGDRIGDLSGDSGVGIGDFSVSLGGGYRSMSGSDGVNYSQKGKEATARGETFFGGNDGPDNNGPSGAGTSRGESASDLAGTGYDGGYSSPFADGGRVNKQEGGEAVAPSGFIEKRTDQVSEAETVADDVPMDVEEGAFIVSGAAIEFMGIADFQKMIQDAVEKARELGIDIPENGGKMGDGEVPLSVSRGEGYISEPLAKIIGYDKLNKINNRGKKEVQQRLQESKQAPEKPQPTDAQGRPMNSGGMASEVGGFLADMTPVVGEIKSGVEAYEAYQKGDVPGMIMGALGAIPIAGKFLKPAGKVAKALADFKPDAILYHATDKDFGKLATQQDVGVHLGSLKVADERAKNISKPTNVDESGTMTTDGIPLDEVPEYKEGTSIRPYAVKFGKVFKTDDALAWDQASAAADTILKSKAGSKLSPDAKKQLQKVRVETESLDSAVDAGIDFDVLNIQGLKKINEILRKEGYDTIQYKNRGEVPGEADYERATFNPMPNELREKSMEDSYIFLDPDKSLRSTLTGKMADGGKVSQGFISRPL